MTARNALGSGLILLAFSASAYAVAEGKSPPAAWGVHIPAGWKLIDHDSDGRSSVLIIEKDDPALRVLNENLGPNQLNLNPRRLLFLENLGAGAVLTGSADNFLPSEHSADTPCLEDPLEEGGIDLAKGALTIRLSYWLSCGSYGVTRKTYKFRAESRRYRLIGYDVASFSRSTGVGQEISINYLTGRKKRVTDIAYLEQEAGSPKLESKIQWSKVGRKPVFLDMMDLQQCQDNSGEAASWCDDG
jgi:hypothetical protein